MKISANISFSFLNLLVVNVFPLITFPYLNRVLSIESMGYFNYINTIISYLTLICSFGINIYGLKIINIPTKENEISRNEKALELAIINLIFSLLAYSFWISFSIFYLDGVKLYTTILLALSLISSSLNFEWYFVSSEQNKVIFYRNLSSRLVTILLIFYFVTEQNDLFFYVLIVTIINLLFSLFGFFTLFRIFKIHGKRITNNLFNHLKPLSKVFTMEVLYRYFGSFEIIVIGFFISSKEMGYVSFAYILIVVFTSFNKVLSMTLLPRLSFLSAKFNNSETENRINDLSIEFILFVAFYLTSIIFIFGNQICSTLGGEKYIESTQILIKLAPIVVLSPLINFQIFQVLYPKGMVKEILKALGFSVVFSLLTLFTLYKYFSISGLLIAINISHLFLFFTLIVFSNKIPWGVYLFSRNKLIATVSYAILFTAYYNLKELLFNDFIFQILLFTLLFMLLFIVQKPKLLFNNKKLL